MTSAAALRARRAARFGICGDRESKKCRRAYVTMSRFASLSVPLVFRVHLVDN